MANRRLEIRAEHGIFAVGLASLICILAVSPVQSNAGESLVRNTIRLSLAWYAAALYVMIRLTQRDWAATTKQGRVARVCWTWGVVAYVVHVALAFHFYHQWSHAHAFEFTRKTSGIGEGIYASYLFTLLWIGDALWWWIQPQQYCARSPWIDRILHTFMLFIVFNGTIVFENGLIRWAGLVMFAALSCAWLLMRSRPQLA